jgi:DNA-binding Lrp family transcriptional regulator
MLEAAEFTLLNRWQRDFPLVPRPYAEIGASSGIAEERVIAIYRRLRARGLIDRIGVAFRPNTVGASTLAAMAVPAARLEEVAGMVSRRAGVNHNYEREHRFNLWFVATGAGPREVERTIEGIERASGLEVLRLPLLEEFHIDLGFDLESGAAPRGAARPAEAARLGPGERRLVAALARGIPLAASPYAELGAAAGLAGEAVIATLRGWLAAGVARRIGVIARHRPLGYAANAMVVWDAPDAGAGDLGRRLATDAAVTLCYRRARALPDWPYNLYCMVHGRSRAPALAGIERLTRAHGLEAYPRAVLFSARCFAQRGARYAREAAHG